MVANAADVIITNIGVYREKLINMKKLMLIVFVLILSGCMNNVQRYVPSYNVSDSLQEKFINPKNKI